jgi:peptidyl-tRNA hydrolase
MEQEDKILRMYAIARNDLNMSPGKMAAQTGHAFLDTYVKAFQRDPDRCKLYNSDSHGTKVVLQANLLEIFTIYEHALSNGLSVALIVDSGHILPPHFTGAPIVTALGIGPVYRHETSFLSSYSLVP